MLREKKRGLILLSAVLLCICMILGFTLQNGEESSETSGRIMNVVMRILYPNIDDMNATDKLSLENEVHRIIRKLGHFSEYTLLGTLLILFWKNLRRAEWPIRYALGCGLVVAAGDETIQSFVPGRGPTGLDVFIDFCGLCTGILAGVIIVQLWKRHRRIWNFCLDR